MKCYIKFNENILAEAQVNPSYCNSHGIDVRVIQGGEGTIPHVHVYWNGHENCAYIDLRTGDYAEHHDKTTDIMTKEIKFRFIENMTNIYEGTAFQYLDGTWHPATGYEYAVQTWCNTYEHGNYSKFNFDLNGRLMMPDFFKLKTRR